MKLIRYEGENVTPSDDAILYRTFLSDGLFQAVTPTFTSGAITIPAMRGVICGRDFTTDIETLTAVLASSGTITGQIYMWIDMEDETYPLSIKIRNSVGSLSDDDINNGGQYYGLEIAQYTANTSAVTGVTLTVGLVGFNGLADIESGWLAILATLTYTSADSPTFVANTSVDLTDRISVGMKLKLTQSTVKYFIVTAITSTTITLYGGTDYTLTSATITDAYFSSVKAPFGFPMDIDIWSVYYENTTLITIDPATNLEWYNLTNHEIDIPIGMWNVMWGGGFSAKSLSAVTYINIYGTLSASNSLETNQKLSARTGFDGASNVLAINNHFNINRKLTLTEKTKYYLNIRGSCSTGNLQLVARGDGLPTYIKAECLYL